MEYVTSAFAASITIPPTVSLFATIFGLIALAGGAAGYFKASRGDSIIKYQATELALRDETNKRLELDNATLRAKCDSQAEQIEILKGLAQGSPQLVELTKQIKKLVTGVAKLNSRAKKK